MRALLKAAALEREPVLVPAGALAEAWRGRARQARLAAALERGETASFGTIAREVGELCGRTPTSDVVDASVVLMAPRVGGVLVTSAPGDLRPLVRAASGHPVRISVC